MSDKQLKFLQSVKAILIVLGVAKRNITLHEKSWLTYFYDGYTPIKAVQEDFDCKLPFIKWSDVACELKTKTMTTYNKVLSDINCGNYVDEEDFITAMDEYAKQQSIAFLLSTCGDMFKHNAEELYVDFIDWQNKNHE